MALVVTLVLLVVALILGITSFQNARLEETMAGNQRAASLALMAAEFGASEFSYAVGPALVVPVRDPAEDESYESYMAAILSAFRDWASSDSTLLNECSLVSVSVASAADSTLPNSCYAISARGGGTSDLVAVDADGLVFSGGKGGILFSSGALSTLPDNLVARRTIRLLVGVVLGESLSPLNFVGALTEYDGIRSQAVLEGEEDVDGYINPAISVSSRVEAEKIIRDVLKAGPDEIISDRVTFVPEEGCDTITTGRCEAGVYHANDVVNSDGVYDGDYEDCDTTNNNLCNYKGGIASALGAPILSKPDEFDAFVDAAVTPSTTAEECASGDPCKYIKPLWISEEIATDTSSGSFINNVEGDQVYFITSQFEVDGYARPVWDDYAIRESDSDSDAPRLERPYMNLGGFSKSGVLIIDGDVQFSGNPEFEGLIIVLGDYKIDGAGNDPTTGAIISAPYSVRYQDTDADGNVTGELQPFRDSSGNLLDVDGNPLTVDSIPVGPDAKVVVGKEPVDPSAVPVEYMDVSYIVDGAGNRLTGLDPVYAPPGCHTPDTDTCTPVAQANIAPENIVRKFDPIGVDVNGGGKQPYTYDYQVLQNAFSLLSNDARVKFVVGQKRLNGSYEYGLKGWGEVVVPPDL
ncbi:PilX N-terminal domain-containing pilus assembly protein [Halomonas aestuarii]|uniref:PilX N-terminal domain-containing pilus assembly protein n=1 Tax=Halomonas aestuarii TaxID=1897729 RepID=UPI000F76EABB|nr:PilX N-terminal domain-containing pilus assembly protein [Halomonas aestuarii]